MAAVPVALARALRCMAVGTALGCWTAGALALDLLQTYRAAADNDPTYAAARASHDANVEKYFQARGGLLPSASISGNRAKNHLNNTSAGFEADYFSKGFTLQLSQPLFNWPAWSAYRQGQSLVSQSEAQLVADMHELMVRVVETYFDVVAAREVLDAQIALEESSREQFELARDSLDKGTGTITEVDEAKARLDLATAQTITARNDIEVKAHTLRELTGLQSSEVRRLRARIVYAQPQPADIAAWVEAAEKDNPSVRARQFALEVADYEIDRSRGAHLPTLELVASRQGARNINTLSGGPNDTTQEAVTLQLNIPLFQGGRQFSRDRETVALRERTRAELFDARRSARQLARQSYLAVISGMSQSIALESALASSLSSLAGNRMAFEVGTRRNLDVLNAIWQVSDSQQKLTKARVDTIVAQIKLKAAVGRLAESDLGQLNSFLGD